MSKRELNAQQKLFVSEYLVDLNATKAAIRAGYSVKNADKIGSELLGKTRVKEAVNEQLAIRQKRTLITADRILVELAAIAFADITQAFDDNGWLKPLKDIPENVRKAIAGLELSELFDGQGDQKHIMGVLKKIRFADKLKAQELLGKHLKLFTDKHEVTGSDGGALKIEISWEGDEK